MPETVTNRGGFGCHRFLRCSSASASRKRGHKIRRFQQHVAKSERSEADDAPCPPPICNGLGNQSRTVVGGTPTWAAIGRNPIPQDAARSAVATVSTLSQRRG